LDEAAIVIPKMQAVAVAIFPISATDEFSGTHQLSISPNQKQPQEEGMPEKAG